MTILHPISKPVMPYGGDVAILGSTGSIGVATLDVLRQISDRPFRVKSLVCGHNTELLIRQALEFKPQYVACAHQDAYQTLKDALPDCQIYVGQDGILEVCAKGADYVMSAIVGQAGLLPTITAAKQDTVIALANKECIVVGGQAFLNEIEKKGAVIFPVDSEHSALYHLKSGIQKIDRYTITASGGPFLDRDIDDLKNVTISDALKHPNWDMGHKISIDSATMANKGLELIEAKILFDLKDTQIDAVIHRQSIIHGLVSYKDGAVKLYASRPDMHLAIGASLNYGAFNAYCFAKPIDFTHQAFSWDFEPINTQKFPCFELAKRAMSGHFLLPAIFNAANEVAVEAFLKQKIMFIDIAIIIKKVIDYIEPSIAQEKTDIKNLTHYLDIHKKAEQKAWDFVAEISNKK